MRVLFFNHVPDRGNLFARQRLGEHLDALGERIHNVAHLLNVRFELHALEHRHEQVLEECAHAGRVRRTLMRRGGSELGLVCGGQQRGQCAHGGDADLTSERER